MRATTIALLLAVSACKSISPEPSKADVNHAEATASLGSERPLRKHARQRGPTLGCSTLQIGEEADSLRMTRDGTTVLYVSDQVGLAIVDVANPDQPKLLTTSEFHGEPLGVFERERGAIVVYAPWDRIPAETVVRAVETRGRNVGRTISEVALPGAPRDARGVGDAVVVTRELPPRDGKGSASTAATSFFLDERELAVKDEVLLEGGGAIMGGSPFGIALALAKPADGHHQSVVSWFDVDEETHRFIQHPNHVVKGVVPRWRRATDHVLDVAEDARVRMVLCAAATCAMHEDAVYSEVDFSRPNAPRTTTSFTLARSAVATLQFTNDKLIVARAPVDNNADATEILSFGTTGRELAPLGVVRVRGTVGSLAIRNDSIVAIGWTGVATTGRHAMIHHVDMRKGLRLRGTASFGGDWTWSPAYDDERAFAFDPRSTLAALPMTTLRSSDGAYHATQILELGPLGHPTAKGERLGDADRVLFVDGRLLAFSASGVTVVVRIDDHETHERRWGEL